jgi:myo-inositol-1(or 4)-monophosphatase
VLASTHPDLFSTPEQAAALTRVKSVARLTRYGGDCYNYCLLASGFVDVIIETDLKPYDIVALIPIIERAGGRVTTWTGGDASGGGDIIASGDARLHEAVLALINEG